MSPVATIDVTGIGTAWWRAVIDNPPINLYDPDFQRDVTVLVSALENDPDVKVVTFESAHPDFFVAHIDLLRVGEDVETVGPTGLPPWPDALVRLENAPVVTVGVLRGRARGVGSELLLALDVRFASRERAVLCQPEVGFGFFPGGGGMERLPLAVGRARALEIMVGCEDFDADTAERYGWVNRSVPDADLDAFVARFAGRVAAFDREALEATKALLNQRVPMATGEHLRQTQERFLEVAAGPATARHVATFLELGGQQSGRFELDLAENLTTI